MGDHRHPFVATLLIPFAIACGSSSAAAPGGSASSSESGTTASSATGSRGSGGGAGSKPDGGSGGAAPTGPFQGQWVQRAVPTTTPNDTPYATGWSAGVFDSARGEVIVYERYVDAQNAWFFYSNALWGYDADLNSWHLRAQSPWRNVGYCDISNVDETYTFPWDRHPYGGMAFDPATATMVLFGGPSWRCFGTDDDQSTWLFHADSDQWERVQTAPAEHGYESTFTFDTARGRVISNGGLSNGSDFYSYDVQARAWSSMPVPTTLSDERDLSNLVYSSASDKVLFFGGRTYGGPGTNETWILDARAGIWSRITPPTLPPGRYAHGLAYDPARDIALLYGGLGQNDEDVLHDTWLFHFADETWEKIGDTGPDIHGYEVPLVFDSKHQVFTIPVANAGGVYDSVWTFETAAQ